MGKPTGSGEEDTNNANKQKEKDGFRSELSLRCEWVDCDFLTGNANELQTHVEEHEPFAEIRDTNGKQIEWQCCMWDSCGFNSQSQQTARFHINYHGFHTRIKALGVALLNQQQDLECHLDYANRNILPVLPEQRACEWRSCDFITSSYQRLLEHLNDHVTGRPRRRKNQTVFCEWQGCTKVNKDMTKLKSHVKSHTQEKAIACPVCGVQFASKTKFIDHCARQAPPEKKLHQCSYCKKRFPSERILQDHIRLHVNLHKCPMCDMTCPFRYTLALHIRYRHLSMKPFKCNFCDHRSTTERDLKTHYQTHCSEDGWVCDQADCDFSCRSKNGLKTHYAKTHLDTKEEYGCHICDARYNRGAELTVHLRKKHRYRWASGQSRFRYNKDEAGVHRLQTVRYESMEVTEQIMANAAERFTCVTQAPDRLVITQDVVSSALSEGSCVDPDDPDEVDFDDHVSESAPSVLSTSIERHEDVDEEFSESLKKHLGVQYGFIHVVKVD